MVLLFIILYILSLCYKVFGNYGIILATSSNHAQKKFCMKYSTSVGNTPHSEAEAVAYPLLDIFPWDGCKSDQLKENVQDKVVIIRKFPDKNTCDYVKQTLVLENAGAAGVIMVISKKPRKQANLTSSETVKKNETILQINTSYSLNASHKNSTNVAITLAVINDEIYSEIKEFGENCTVKLYGPKIDVERVDYSLIAIWVIAVFVLGTGCYWSGIIHYDFIQQRRRHRPRITPESSAARSQRRRTYTKVFIINVLMIALLVLLMCGLLLLLYFFYSYLVYFIIALFCIASTAAVFQIVDAGIKKIPCKPLMLPKIKICKQVIHIAAYQVVLAIGCISLTVFWVIHRNHRYGWILQDILGIFFCINILRTLRLPNGMICTVLMVLLFFYDIFFVFITPLFTKSGESIMVHVATGGGTEEQLPMVFKFPHLRYVEVFDLCAQQEFSLLGFGDILVPGLFVSFLHGFDMEIDSKHLYYLSGLISYGIGLILTFVGMFLMRSAQPALLYLVPCTLIPVFVIALCRREMKALWLGNAQLARRTQVPAIATTPQSDERIGDNPSPTSNEENQLIRE